ncbi:hypothetical protein ANCCAN_08929 [Ancylostoma caninum]|uniref:Uncharacterized protein n=1 Tax=Ancylostoma caninum TaxID=29170 RepID=A0A368GL35_ANCCA|nr:hypothetical protein ANCCAN_08929 [Ancylostoma caninum]
MATEAGWEPRRPIVIWGAGSTKLSRATVGRSTLDWERKLLNVSLDAFAWSSRTLEKATKRFGRRRPDDDGYSLDICVRLTKAPPTANPTYEHIFRLRAFANLQGETTASKIMDRVYGATELGCAYRTEPALFEMEEGYSVYNLNGQDVTLTEEQRRAVDLGTKNLTPTPVDMNRILMSLDEEFEAELTDEEKALCLKFETGRSILERYIENPDLALDMSEEDKEEYAIAERNVSNTVRE